MVAPEANNRMTKLSPWYAAIAGVVALTSGCNGSEDSSGTDKVGRPSTGAAATAAVPVSGSAPNRVAAGAIEARQQALTTNEATVLSASGMRFSETASAALLGSDGTWQTVVFGNQMNATGSVGTPWQYGCIRGSTTQCNNSVSLASLGSDPSALVGGGFVYGSRLQTGGGMSFIRTSNACNSSCAAGSWGNCSANFGADFPHAVTADASTYRFVFNDFAALPNVVTLGTLSWCTSVGWHGLVGCNLGSDSRRNAHAVLGGNGVIHVVYANQTLNRVEYTQYNLNTSSWNCSPVVIGDINQPSGTCPGSSRRVLPSLGNNATTKLEYSYAPRIARDPASGILVATWDSFDSSINRVRSRAFQSTNGGASWNWTLLTSDETFHSVVAAGSVAHRFEIGQTYNFAGTGTQGAQVSWQSTNGGGSWSGVGISSSRNLAPAMGSGASRPCHWGDYEGLSFHAGNSAFFHTWIDTNQGPEAVIRGRFINQ
jgi:hypothetical protein